MKILIGSSTYPLLNGVTTSIDLSIDNLNKAGIQSLVVGPEYNLGISRPEYRAVSASQSVKLLLKLFNKKERLFSHTAIGEIEEIAADFKPDLFWLHSVTWNRNAFETVMLHSPQPKVLTYHTLVAQYGRIYAGPIGSTVMKRRSKALANSMNAVITPSKYIAKTLASYGITTPTYVIPTGITIPTDQFSKEQLAKRFHFSSKTCLMIYVGRVSAEKNIDFLLETTQQLQKFGHFTLLLVGPGDLLQTHQKASQMGIADHVITTGPLPKDDAQRVYGGGDYFVFASQTETQGLVIGEAMMAGLPVVALDSPVQNEVYPEPTAKLIRDQEEFVQTVRLLEHNVDLRRKQTQFAKAFVEEHFSIQQMTQKQQKLFASLIQDSSSKS